MLRALVQTKLSAEVCDRRLQRRSVLLRPRLLLLHVRMEAAALFIHLVEKLAPLEFSTKLCSGNPVDYLDGIVVAVFPEEG